MGDLMRIYKKLPLGGTVMGMTVDEIEHDTQKEKFDEMDMILYRNCYKGLLRTKF